MGQTVPDLIADLRQMIVRKTGKPIDPDIDFLTTQIELRSASEPTIIMGLEYGLTPKQSEVLSHLARRPGMVYTREAVMNAVYSDRADQPDPKLFDVMVCKIRQKLKKHGAPYWIETVWAQGFKFVHTPARDGEVQRPAWNSRDRSTRAA